MTRKKVDPRLQELFRQVGAEVVSNSGNKIHQTMGLLFSLALPCKLHVSTELNLSTIANIRATEQNPCPNHYFRFEILLDHTSFQRSTCPKLQNGNWYDETFRLFSSEKVQCVIQLRHWKLRRTCVVRRAQLRKSINWGYFRVRGKSKISRILWMISGPTSGLCMIP